MPDRPTAEDLARWQGLCDEATPGPLEFAEKTDMSLTTPRDEAGYAQVVVWGRNWDAESYDPGSVSGIASVEDGRLFAESNTAMTRLIAEVRRLNELLAENGISDGPAKEVDQ